MRTRTRRSSSLARHSADCMAASGAYQYVDAGMTIEWALVVSVETAGGLAHPASSEAANTVVINHRGSCDDDDDVNCMRHSLVAHCVEQVNRMHAGCKVNHAITQLPKKKAHADSRHGLTPFC